MSQKQTTRKERRIAARKKQILQAATKVFAEKGFHRATTKEIAEVADVSEGTIYNYFDSKDDLLVSMIGSMAALSQNQETFEAALQLDFREFLIDFSLKRQLGTADRHKMLLGVYSELLHHPELLEKYGKMVMQPGLEIFESHLRARIEAGHMKPVDDLPLTSRVLLATSLGLWLLLIMDDPVIKSASENTEYFVETVVKLIYDQFMVDEDGTD